VPTATRATRAKQKTTKKAPAIKQVECDLGDEGAKILDAMAEQRQIRLAAQREEKAQKEKLDAILPKLKKNQRMTVRAAGIIRGTLSWRGRTNVDTDLLLAGWPEAYEAVTERKTYTQFDPA
jgi:hypothetical protein